MCNKTTSIPCLECLPESNKGLPGLVGDWEINGDSLECTNCGHKRPYVKRNPSIGQDGMTEGQRKAVARIKQLLVSSGYDGGSDYEYKNFEVTITNYGMVVVNSTVGLIGDEETAASLYRKDRIIFIGARGGLKLVNAAKMKRDKNGELFKDFCVDVKGEWALKHLSF